MIEIVFLLSLAFIWLLFASFQDIKDNEVANWISLSLIVFALGFRFFYGLFSSAGFGLFYQGLVGVGIFFILGNLFYYSKLFAGGDAKLLIALGAIIPLSESFVQNIFYMLYFLLLFFFAGAFYGIITSLFLLSRNLKGFKKEFKKRFKVMKNVIYLNVFFALFLIVLGLSEISFLFLGVLILAMPFLYLYAKSVDEACCIKSVPVSKLEYGDWLYEDVKIPVKRKSKNKKSKFVRATWEGLSEEDIKLLNKKFKKNKKIKIRQGIAFVPAMLIGFALFVIFFFLTVFF
ncbi:hypothetical protein GF378_01765 [Candidatus Pacearchaeota archaeon]|nr:hypothetical protein [Candidatus Pacearchaeota archaeon]